MSDVKSITVLPFSDGDMVKKEVSINKRGSLIIPKYLVQDMGFKEGDTFEARKTKAGVSLKKVEVSGPAKS